MSSFRDRFGGLTVEQVKELNEKAKLTCQWEITTETEEKEAIMSRPKKGTKQGDIATLKWKETMIKKYGGENGLHEKMMEIGAVGGRRGHTGGFESNPELARVAGAKGGRASKRGAALDRSKWKEYKDIIIEEYTNGDVSIVSLAKKYGINYEIVRKGLKDECL